MKHPFSDEDIEAADKAVRGVPPLPIRFAVKAAWDSAVARGAVTATTYSDLRGQTGGYFIKLPEDK
jgi:hypothetical protein